MAKRRKNYYGVHIGRTPGVYTNWETCRAQVEGCANRFRGFNTHDEAAFYAATGLMRHEANGATRFAEWKRDRQSRTRGNSVKKVKREPLVKLEAFDASQSYFSQLPDFVPDDAAGFDDEFGRFASSQNIAPGSQAWRQERTNAIRHEVIFHYSQRYASDDDSDDDIKKEDKYNMGLSRQERKRMSQLQVLQNMCREVKLEPLDTIEGCRATLKGVLVNIVDYIDAKRSGNPIKVWAPYEFEKFKRYTLSDEKRIDLEEAKSGDGFLVPLLQVLRSSKASTIYQDRRQRAVIAREDYTSRVPSNNTNSLKKEERLSVIKEDPEASYRAPEQKSEVISIHGSDSDYASSPEPIKEEIIDNPPCPWSPSSIGSSVIEILINSQQGLKRSIDDLTEEQDIPEEEISLASEHKRLRV
ncbi:hypothetical protein ONZ43_g905 [Nemania bipapillata]|uniref:Uncharacterized protein n=1 Tax=Nemania bipapillata TaxID=110536 RepID=A0ACC2J6T5_9PEZI|nr:hypothetical protein ONZ43_g905 [Nemania bipapillata]